MRTAGLLLLSALCSISKSHLDHGEPSKQEPLVRTKRRWVLSTIELQEEDPGPYPKSISKMSNELAGNHEFHISGNGVDQDPINVFTINSHTGEVFAHRAVDREQYEKPFHIKFDILDKDTKKKLDRELAFDVEVMDLNDNAPAFKNSQMTIEVNEKTTGYLPGKLDVIDRDQAGTPNSKITVSLISQEPKEPQISLEQPYNTQAQLTLKSGCFDYDKIKKYEVRLLAKDQGQPSLSSTAVLTINILDGNTHPPMFKEKEYQGEVMELQIIKDVLRVAVEDKDTPNTPGWRAKYFIIKGNEEGSYEIETDLKTNEGILSVVKGKDYESTSFVTLEVGVRNEEPLWVCKEKASSGTKKDFYDSAVIKIKVKDVNDPPVFAQNPAILHVMEEEDPGKVLFTPEVKDVDSDVSQIRYEVLEDPNNYVSIDKKTGKLTSVKKMDRELALLNGTGIYTILIAAIDNGEPPATATCTVQIHLSDINDNKPELVNKGVTLCANKGNKVMVAARDADISPYAGPFFFSLKNDEKILKLWKLDPSSGDECGLVSKKDLYFGNYLVPLEIRDQQNMLAQETLEVMVCDCEEENVCRSKKRIGASIGPAGIGAAFAGLLFFLLLLLIFICKCKKDFKPIKEEGIQTFMNYNQEGGLSECKTDPILLLTPTGSTAVTDGVKKGFFKASQYHPATMDGVYGYKSSALGMGDDMNLLGGWRQRDTLSRNGAQTFTRTTVSTSTLQRGALKHSLLSDQHISDHLNRRLYTLDGTKAYSPEFGPFIYAHEGGGSRCPSLDGISMNTTEEDLTFLNNLGPKFKTLGQICQQALEQKDVEL
ncbi:cadherin-like protein 26 isoform X2 [Takifugu rubripes]|uniref:cadherin-like protein 26 isoform X2 n=1 Tax=Takifugu rubripes TaxID=31033 RepID=UPI0011458202|nr:cadherin-like protein 26 isoform X2 [Takifugu rubripes]